MCDTDVGADIDFSVDSDVGDSSEDTLDFADEIGISDLESMADVDDVSFESETVESIQDMEAVSEGIDTEDYPALSEFEDLDDQTIDIEGLEDMSNQFQEEIIDSNDTLSLSELDDVKPELIFSQEELQELYEEHVENPQFWEKMNELIASGRVSISEMEDIDETGEEGVKVLTREITPEIQESRERDTEKVLDNYRENLQERGVSEEQIKEFIEHERESINAEYENLDAGKPSENIYQMPTDWDTVAEDIEYSNDIPSVEIGSDTVSEIDDGNRDINEQDDGLADDIDSLTSEETAQEISGGILLSEMEDIDDVESDSSDVGEGIGDLSDEETEPVIEEINVEGDSEEISEESIVDESEEDNLLIDEAIDEPEVISDALDDSLHVEEDLDEIVDDVTTEQIENVSDDIPDMPDENTDETQEIEINYDEIYEEILQESLKQGFEKVDIYEDQERLDASLENFESNNWENLSVDDQKQAMSNLAEYLEDVIGFDNPPKIEHYNNPREGDYGEYNSQTNTLSINEYMLYNSSEAADTIAHELWHAHQHECADHPSSARDYQYQYNFENYICPEMGHEAYENQLIEAEARAFAAQFKGRLAEIASRR